MTKQAAIVTQKTILLESLEQHGWDVVKDVLADLEWWADEVWSLRFMRNQHACNLYLTFVIDPQWEGPRRKGEGVWAVTASRETPHQWGDVALDLGRGWRKRLPPFLERLDELCSAVSDNYKHGMAAKFIQG